MSEHVGQADAGRCFACGTPVDQVADRERLRKGWARRLWVLLLFQLLLTVIGGLLLVIAAMTSLSALDVAGGGVMGFSVGMGAVCVWIACKLPKKR